MAAKPNFQSNNSDAGSDSYRNYLELRTALYHFGKVPQALDSKEEQQKLFAEVMKQESINLVVQKSKEFSKIVVSEQEISESLKEICEQINANDSFDLTDYGLNDDLLHDAVALDLHVAAVLNYVAERSIDVSDTDAELFYRMHEERFVVPEKREARHILITINEEYKENKRKHANARINQVREQVIQKPNQFAKFAKAHSECPTALEGGKLGKLLKGQLYPELDFLLFTMREGAVSEVVESELGFHILKCDAIEPSSVVPFESVKEKIKTALQQRNQRAVQKKWLSELIKKGKELV